VPLTRHDRVSCGDTPDLPDVRTSRRPIATHYASFYSSSGRGNNISEYQMVRMSLFGRYDVPAVPLTMASGKGLSATSFGNSLV
jgi:hypothetical protein